MAGSQHARRVRFEVPRCIVGMFSVFVWPKALWDFKGALIEEGKLRHAFN